MPSRRPDEAVDPDVDLHVPAQRREWSAHRFVLPVIALGGMLGASGRYAVELALPHPVGGFPWSTFGTNVLGCALIGVLMVNVVELGRAHPLVRPFLGVGLLGGFTTYSTYAVQTQDLLRADRPGLALAYLLGTLVAALLAVAVGVWSARLATSTKRWLSHHRGGSR